MTKRKTYNDFVESFSSKGCKLITTETDLFSTKNVWTYNVVFTASCGHDNTCTMINIYYADVGVLCKECVNKRKSEKMSLLYPKNSNTSNAIEYEGFKYLVDLLATKFVAVRTTEGCLADVIIKPINELSNQWMKIQLKVTKGVSSNQYRFNITNVYVDCLFFCISLEDKKIWIADYDNIKHLTVLSIGRTKSINNNYYLNCYFLESICYLLTSALEICKSRFRLVSIPNRNHYHLYHNIYISFFYLFYHCAFSIVYYTISYI